ncbi:MAG: VanW family protein [Nocardioides sp.]
MSETPRDGTSKIPGLRMTPGAWSPGAPAPPRPRAAEADVGAQTPDSGVRPADDEQPEFDDFEDTAERPKIVVPPPVDRDRPLGSVLPDFGPEHRPDSEFDADPQPELAGISSSDGVDWWAASEVAELEPVGSPAEIDVAMDESSSPDPPQLDDRDRALSTMGVSSAGSASLGGPDLSGPNLAGPGPGFFDPGSVDRTGAQVRAPMSGILKLRPPRRRRFGGRLAIGGLAGALLLLGVAYAGLHAMAADRLPRGLTIARVDVGGRTPSVAERVLREGLATRAAMPLDVTIDGQTRAISPISAGLSVDYAASIGEVEPASWSPASLWNFLVGGEDRDAVVDVDDAKLTTVLDEVAAQVASPATEGAVAFTGNRYSVTEPKAGAALDTEAAAKAVRAAYLDPEATVELDLADAPPDIDQGDVDEAVESFAKPAVSGAITIRFGAKKLTLKPAEFTPLLSMKSQDGVLVPAVQAKKLSALARPKIPTEGAPVPATVRLVDGRPRVVPAKPGVTYAPDNIAEAFLAAAAAQGPQRSQQAKPTDKKPAFTTQDARDLKIRRKVSTFTTYYPYAEYRNVNIPRAAELVNGTVLKPGETFSLNGVVGERTVANGFTKGFIISNGLFAEDLGGGVSQMATTTYNAAYFAGLEDVEHWPHSFYIDRYPPGREATVAWGAKDLRFKNDTPYGILIQAEVSKATSASSGVVTVSMWSTKVWSVTTSSSSRYNLTSPGTQTLTTDNCVPNEGYGGFEIDVTRYWRKPGQSTVVKKETKHTTYIPADTVICKPPDPPAP